MQEEVRSLCRFSDHAMKKIVSRYRKGIKTKETKGTLFLINNHHVDFDVNLLRLQRKFSRTSEMTKHNIQRRKAIF